MRRFGTRRLACRDAAEIAGIRFGKPTQIERLITYQSGALSSVPGRGVSRGP